MRAIRWIVAAAVSVFLVGGPAGAGMWTGGEPFFEMQEIYEGQRFPSIVVANDGTVLAFRGQNAPIQVRRSEDGGETWGPIIEVGGDNIHLGAAVVDEVSGDVMVFQNERLFRSQDAGLTWEEDEDAVILPDGNNGIGNTHGADSGITLRYGEHDGRLLLPARVLGPEDSNDREWWPYHYNTAIFSDDHGKTWQTSHPFPVLGTGEGAVAELADGTIYYNSRIHMATDALRRIAWSDDGGETWRNPTVAEDIPDGPRGTYYGCMAGLTRLPLGERDILIYSNLDEETGVRRGITVWASFDGGQTWPVKRQVFAGPSAYSSLTVGRDDTPSEGLIYLQFEGGEDHHYDGLRVARFNLAWLLNGQDPDEFTGP